MNERSQPEDNHQQFAANADRYHHFVSIWNKTEGSVLEKTLAMLGDYSRYLNWGATYAGEVREVIGSYGGWCGYVEKFNLYSDIRFLLLYLSEKIPFHAIKQDGDLAAIFYVIEECTKINAYDFDQGTELYLAYDKVKSEIKKYAAVVDNWRDVIKRLYVEFCDPSLVKIFLKAKFINGCDSWRLITNPDRRYPLPENWRQQVEVYNNHIHFSEDELPGLFCQSLKKGDYEFAQWTYCKKYNLEMEEIVPADSVEELIQELCELTNKNIDGTFLLYAIQFLDKGYYWQHNFMLMALTQKRDLIENWNDLKGALIDGFASHLRGFFIHAVRSYSVKAVDCLLSDKNFNMNAGRYIQGLSPSKQASLIQIAIVEATYLSNAKESFLKLADFRDTLKLLVEYNPDCVRIKDSDGKDIFWYLGELRKEFIKQQMSADAMNILDEVYQIIRKPFIRNIYTFFSGQSEKASNVHLLNQDIFKVLAGKTMQLM